MSDLELEQDIEQVESDIENVKKAIRRYDDLQTLMNTPEWKKLIEEGYLRDEAARVVSLKGDLQMRMAGEVQREWLEDMITGIGAFKQYLNFIRQAGASAKQQLAQHQETHATLLKEQMGGSQ